MTFILAESQQEAHRFAVHSGIYSWKYVNNRNVIRKQEDCILFKVKGWEKRDCLLLTGVLMAEILIFSINNTIVEVSNDK